MQNQEVPNQNQNHQAIPEENQRVEKLKRQRKLLLFLPVLVVPVLVLAFFLFSSNSQATQSSTPAADSTGLNTYIPVADVEENQEISKAAAYKEAEAAEEDQQKRLEEEKKMAFSDFVYKYDEVNEEIDHQAIEEEVTLIAQDEQEDEIMAGYYANDDYREQSEVADKLDQLIALMEAQLEDQEQSSWEKYVEDSLQQIANQTPPEREVETIVELPEPRREVVSTMNQPTVEDTTAAITENQFYGMAESSGSSQFGRIHNTIKAAIHGDQTITSGSTVKLRLLTDIEVNGRLVPRGTFLFAQSSLQGERTQLEIQSLQYAGNLFEVELKAFGLDGLPGLYIPGSMTRQAAKDAVDESTDDTLEEDILGESAGTLIKTGKSLFGKKLKLVKVTLKAGTQVLLI